MSQTLAYGVFDREFGFDSHEWVCSYLGGLRQARSARQAFDEREGEGEVVLDTVVQHGQACAQAKRRIFPALEVELACVGPVSEALGQLSQQEQLFRRLKARVAS